MPTRQFSLAYVMVEIALIAIAFGAVRLAMYFPMHWIEAQTACFCFAVTASCGAVGGICLRMAMGLVAGGATMSRAESFAAIVALARERAAMPVAPRRVAARTPVPYISEPWYCCAEPMEMV